MNSHLETLSDASGRSEGLCFALRPRIVVSNASAASLMATGALSSTEESMASMISLPLMYGINAVQISTFIRWHAGRELPGLVTRREARFHACSHMGENFEDNSML